MLILSLILHKPLQFRWNFCVHFSKWWMDRTFVFTLKNKVEKSFAESKRDSWTRFSSFSIWFFWGSKQYFKKWISSLMSLFFKKWRYLEKHFCGDYYFRWSNSNFLKIPSSIFMLYCSMICCFRISSAIIPIPNSDSMWKFLSNFSCSATQFTVEHIFEPKKWRKLQSS